MAEKKPSGTKLCDVATSELPNKPNEPNFKMTLSCSRVVFKCTDDHKPVNFALKFTNPTSELVCFKVRCTSAEIFRVQPPLGSIKPQSTVDITIWFQNQTKLDTLAGKHYFAFYHTKGDARTPKEIWQNAKIEGVRRVPAIFEVAVKSK